MSFEKLSMQILISISITCFCSVCFFLPVNAQVNDQYMHIPENKVKNIEKVVDVGENRKLHCRVFGQGSPCIVLVSGFMATQNYWNTVIPDLYKVSTIVTYDRAGIGKSIKNDIPVDAEQSAKDLHVLLKKLKVPEPYIIVGHSFGVHIARLFASLYTEDMGGLILEDGSHESLIPEQLKVLKGKDLEILKQHLPGMDVPENPRNEGDYRGINNKKLKNSAPLPHIPFVVITSGNRANSAPPFFSESARKDIIELGRKNQQKLVGLIPGGKHIIAEGAGHNIHVEKPEILIDQIIEMIEKIRSEKNIIMTQLKGPYLGQKSPGLAPQIFAPDIVSTDAHEFACTFTPDGKEFYFTRMDPGKRRNQIMETKMIDGTWTKPAVVPFINNKLSFEPRITPDGKRLYFTLEKMVSGQKSGIPMNIWYVEREGKKWSELKDPGAVFNPGKTMYVSATLDGTVYASDISSGPGNIGILVIKNVNGQYRKSERLGPPVNTGNQEMFPYIAPDESYMIFTSRRPVENINSELFVSFRKKDGSWGEPRGIDLGLRAGCPMISSDGKYLFFTAGERGKSDIYWVDAKVIKGLKR